MKKAKEYFQELLEKHPYKQSGNRDSYSQYNEGWQDVLDLAMQVAKQVQLDTIEETIKECIKKVILIENARTNGTIIKDKFNINHDFYIDKQSILDCAEILKKEIE